MGGPGGASFFIMKQEELRKLIAIWFEDDSIDLILNARGGYGSIRLINDIDDEIIVIDPDNEYGALIQEENFGGETLNLSANSNTKYNIFDILVDTFCLYSI